MKISFIALLTLFAFYVSSAQNSPPKELRFNHLYIEDGLPERSILSLLQDKEGYMWIGTQNGLVRYDGYKLKVYKFGIEDLLSIGVIYEDRKGALWIGTGKNGLYRYDRAKDEFIHFNPKLHDSISLSQGSIFGIHDDPRGNLWIELGEQLTNSINYFNTKTGVCKRYSKDEKGAHSINATELFDIFEDSQGRFWVGSDNGLQEYNYKGDRFIPHFASADTSQRKALQHIEEDPSQAGTLWFGATNIKPLRQEGLWRYNTNNHALTTFHQSDESGSLANNFIGAIYKGSKDRLWIRTKQGFSLFDPKTEHFINYNSKEENTNANFYVSYELKEDKYGNFWCNSPSGLFYFDTRTGKFTFYTANEKEANGLAANLISHLLIDRTGTLWLGVGGAGADGVGLQWVNKSRSKITVYKDNPEQPHHFSGGRANYFAEAPDKTLWLAAANGLYHWLPDRDSFILIKSVPQHFTSPFVAVDKEGLVWYGGWEDKGLYCYNPITETINNYRNKEKDSTSLSNDFISSLLVDHSGILWVGTLGGGLCRFNKRTQNFTRYPYVDNAVNVSGSTALDDPNIFALCEDGKGILWIGTNAGTLNKLNKEARTFTSYKKQLPKIRALLKIYEDNKGRLWVGAYIGGLILLDRKTNTAKRFTEKEGLLFDGAWGIVEDNSSNLWVSSTRGISIFNPETNKVSTLTYVNGLPATSPLGFGSFKTSKGLFLMACSNGFITLNPDEFAPDSNGPVVHIEAIDFAKQLTEKKKLEDSSMLTYGKSSIDLRYNENRITFHYVGLQYQNAELSQYAYKLDGYDKDWIQAGTQKNITYTNLSPGTYTFHVKAANSDGVWSTKEDAITIIIAPPWWKTWWAYSLYALLIAAAIRAYVVYRSRALRQENLLLEQKVAHRTHEVEMQKEKIETQRDSLEQTLSELKSTQSQLIQSEKMASLGELTAGIAHEIQNPLNFVNNFSEVNAELIEELKVQRSKDKSERDELSEDELINDIAVNEQKINHHGKRADAIVKGMLQHSRVSTGQKEPANINALANEYLRLSYHGIKAKDKSFNATLKTDFDESLGKINVIPQDIGRVLLNLYNNAFYAVSEKNASTHRQAQNELSSAGQLYEPTVSVNTKKINDKVEIRVVDNGNGIPQKVIDKIFQPFFTTKPTGQGTGLGLSLSYDIIKAHGGEINVETKEGEGAEFIIQLPISS